MQMLFVASRVSRQVGDTHPDHRQMSRGTWIIESWKPLEGITGDEKFRCETVTVEKVILFRFFLFKTCLHMI